jgi:hypothetical protein
LSLSFKRRAADFVRLPAVWFEVRFSGLRFSTGL